MRMKRSIKLIEDEIMHQILFAELALEICKMMPIIPGRGSDFLPYYYNLNYSKAIISLHSLLLSKKDDEISLSNYIKQHEWNYRGSEDIKDFKITIKTIASSLEKIYKPSLRHKVAAHVSQDFKHTDFTSAYIMPAILSKLSTVAKNLKDAFSTFCNYDKNQDPFFRIKYQTKAIIDLILKNDF